MTTVSPLSEIFILREIRELRRVGWNIRIGELRPLGRIPPASGFKDLDCLVIRANWFSLDMLKGLVFFAFRRPRGVWDCFGLVCRSLDNPLRMVKMLYILLASLQLAYRAHSLEPRLVRAHFLFSAALAAQFLSRLLNVPYSLTVYTTFEHYPRAFIQTMVKEAVFLVADTHQAKQFLQELGAEASRIHVIHNSVCPEEFQVRRKISHQVPVILGVGRLDAKKGFHVLLHACALLRERGVLFQAMLIGDGPEKRRLFRLRGQLGLVNAVKMLGKLPFEEVKTWFDRADVFVMPSVVTADGDADGLPTVVIEAMASGLPVVGTTTGGIPEAVRDGITGFLVPANSPEPLARRIQQLLEHEGLRIQFGLEGRRVVERDFDLRCKADLLTDLIRRYLGAAGANGKPTGLAAKSP